MSGPVWPHSAKSAKTLMPGAWGAGPLSHPSLRHLRDVNQVSTPRKSNELLPRVQARFIVIFLAV
jgi:hypothetical protein